MHASHQICLRRCIASRNSRATSGPESALPRDGPGPARPGRCLGSPGGLGRIALRVMRKHEASHILLQMWLLPPPAAGRLCSEPCGAFRRCGAAALRRVVLEQGAAVRGALQGAGADPGWTHPDRILPCVFPHAPTPTCLRRRTTCGARRGLWVWASRSGQRRCLQCADRRPLERHVCDPVISGPGRKSSRNVDAKSQRSLLAFNLLPPFSRVLRQSGDQTGQIGPELETSSSGRTD
jgi:hypothetical protein